jgi:hypothetical protein
MSWSPLLLLDDDDVSLPSFPTTLANCREQANTCRVTTMVPQRCILHIMIELNA